MKQIVVNEEQSADDMLQNEPAELSVWQQEELIDGNEVGAVNEEPLGDYMLQDYREEDIHNVSTSQQPSNLKSLDLGEQDGTSLSMYCPHPYFRCYCSYL